MQGIRITFLLTFEFMLQRNVFLLFLSLSCLTGLAQVNNTGLESKIFIKDSNAHEIGLSIYDASFLRNNEYMHDIATGYTLFGNHFTGSLYYQMNKNWKVQGGMYVRRDFGAKGMFHIQPLMTIKYEQKGFSFLMGNLEGQLSHRLLEPIFNYERYITDYNETGAQFKINRRKLWSDTWISWEVMQYNRSDYQEEFVAGHHTQYHVWMKEKQDIMLDAQVLIHHKGGQIDIDTNRMRTRMNSSLGATYTFSGKGRIKKLQLSQYILFYQEAAPSSDIQITKGKGYYSTLTLEGKQGLVATLNYWNGENFLATHGGFLFQSQSSEYNQKTTFQKHRELLFLRCMYQKEVAQDIYMDIRFEPYYDLRNALFEYGYAFYLIYKKNFTIGKLKFPQIK